MSFHYPPGFFQPLDRKKHEVRILELHPGLSGSTIRCNLEVQVLFELPEYAALSYSWGQIKDTVEIIVNDLPIPITKNLESALQHLRKGNTPRVWVDALCISQEDDQEKSDQIRYIAQIYSRAYVTVSWLGGPTEGQTVAGLKFLRNVASKQVILPSSQALNVRKSPVRALLASFPWRWKKHSAVKLTSIELSHLLTEDEESTHGQDDPSEAFQDLLQFLSCEYWKRRWIIQEIAVSDRIFVCCGEEALDFSSMRQRILRSRRSPDWGRGHERAYEYLEQILDFRYRYVTAKKPSLCEAVVQTYNFRSELTHDRIFALIGFCADGRELVPIPSYSQSIEAVVATMTKEIIRKHMCFDIIFADVRDKAIPSAFATWVPDITSSGVSLDAYTAATSKQNTVHFYITQGLRGQSNELILQGVTIANIISLTSTLGYESQSQSESPPQRASALRFDDVGKDYYGDSITKVTEAVVECLLAPGFARPQHDIRCHHALFAFFQYLQNQKPQAGKMKENSNKSTKPVLAMDFDSWLEANRDFNVCGIPLGNRLRLTRLTYIIQWLHSWWIPGYAAIVITLTCWLIPLILSIIHFKGFLLFFLALFSLFLGLYPIVRLTHEDWKLGQVRKIVYYSADIFHQNPRKIVLCDNGIVAAACPGAAVGDKICLVAGCTSAVVLRQTNVDANGQPQYILIGKAYASLTNSDWRKYAAFSLQVQPHVVGTMWQSWQERYETYSLRYVELVSEHLNEDWWEEFHVF